MGLPQYIKPDIETWLKSFRFKTTFRTRFSETDAFGHINNVSYFTYFEQARIDYFEHLQLFNHLNNIKELQGEANDNLIVTASLECNYLAQLFYGQDIDIYVRTSRLGNSSLDLEYAIVERENKKLVAVGTGAIVNINGKTNKSEPLPSFIKDKINEYETFLNKL